MVGQSWLNVVISLQGTLPIKGNSNIAILPVNELHEDLYKKNICTTFCVI